MKKKDNFFALHLTLGQAKAMGTKLIVGVHTDAEIAKHKVGKLSPLFHNFHIVTVVKGIKCLMHACCCPCADYLCFGFIICFFHRDPLSLMSRRDTEWCEQSNGWMR